MVATVLSGQRGKQSPEARVQFVFTGVTGTMLVNLMRVSAVGALVARRRQNPAVLFYDYGGTISVVGWLFAFWTFAQRWILRPAPSEELEVAFV